MMNQMTGVQTIATATVTETTTDSEVRKASDIAKDLLATTRYDAFCLMTEARKAAKSILDEARAEAAGTLTAARITFESSSERAASEAEAKVLAAQEEAAAIVARAYRSAGEHPDSHSGSALEDEHRNLSLRVSSLQRLADELEARFTTLVVDAENSPTPPSTSTEAPASNATSGEPVIDYSPSVAPSKSKPAPTHESTPDRRSFYNRRSAHLPSVGENSGRNTLEMMRLIRASFDTDPSMNRSS